jgi:hypothetical protein
LFGRAQPASAANGAAPESTILRIEQLKPLPLGDHPTVVVHLTTARGIPIAHAEVVVSVDGIRKETGLTDSEGTAYIILRYKFAAGSHSLTATYSGSPTLDLAGATGTQELKVEAAALAIRTIPPLPGIRFAYNDQVYVSDAQGSIHIRVETVGSYPLVVLDPEGQLVSPDTRATFARWNDEVFEPSRDITVTGSRTLEAGFELSHPIRRVLIDDNDALVDRARLTSMTLRAGGTIYELDDAENQWLPANRLTRRIGTSLESQPRLYYVTSAIIDGENAVAKGQQRFHVLPGAVWNIKVRVYAVRFLARDVLFHYPIGKGIRLEFPDGRITETSFGPAAEIEIPSLVRGAYRARAIGAPGSTSLVPIALSRSQTVELPVLSYIDMAVLAGVPAIIALALLFIGRPHLFPVLRRHEPSRP